MKKISGIYKIVNRLNNKYYVGSSNNIKSRWRSHKYGLRKGTHHSSHLQNAWNKYGESNFDFIIVEETAVENLANEEQKYLDNIKNSNKESECYNISFLSDKIEMSEATKQKISKSSIGKKLSEETKKKLSELLKGRIISEYTKQKISENTTGKPKPWNNKSKNKEIYHFTNNSKETFTGTQFEFRVKYNLDKSAVSKLIKGKRKCCKGWRLL
jgi:group I intron endonuclease